MIVDILERIGQKVEGIIDDNPEVKEFMGMPVEHDMVKKVSPVIISIGMNDLRKTVAERLMKAHDVEFGQAFHPTALVSKYSKVGEGTVLMPYSVVQASCVIGKHNIINTGAVLEHECVLEDFVHISPNATLCGNVTVGEGAWIGAGATIIQGVKIGKWCIIGAGSVVTKDIPDGYVAYGVPCHRVRNTDEDKHSKYFF